MRDLDVSGQKAGLDREVDPAKVPGRKTRVEAEAGRGPAPAAGPGKRTLVDNSGGHMLESATADAQKYIGELKAALAGQDRAKTKEAATALESALGIIRESVGNAGPNQGAGGMHATLEIFVTAEPLLAKAHATGATGSSGGAPQDAAARGTQGPGQQLPFHDQIQRSFGRHDVSQVQAHTGPEAGAAAGALGARAFTSGNSVAFAGSPDLHTAAHEAAHVVQQKAGVQQDGAVQLKALDGGSGDVHERHADAVADAVVSGKSAESLLDHGPGDGAPAVQRKESAAAPGGDGKQPQDRGGRAPKGAAKPPKGAGGGAHGGAAPKGAAGGAGGGGGGGAASAAGFSGGGGIDGKAIKAQLSQFSQGVTANTNTVAPPDGVHADPKKDSEEDHAKKVSQYDDGIDGIADMIGDLDAFDDLCSSLSWGGDSSKQGEALGRIKQSKPFHQLSQMWQGALDGGPDSPAMQAAFESEFSSRGFFGSTQQAYQLVRDAAKAQAKEDAAAAEAKKKAAQAKAKGDAKGVDGKDAGKTAAGKPNASGVNGGAAGGANAANLNATVQQQAAPIGSYEQLKGVSDAEFKSVVASADHHAGLKESMPSLGAEAPRTGQILDQMKRAGSGFKESFIDTVKWGVIAHVGDKMAAGAVEGLIGEKVPIIGPLIALAVDPPWKGKYWSDTGKGFSDGWKSLKSAFSFDAFKKCHSAGDVVGVLCAKVADLFNTFYQWLSTINKLLGTLSAICLILGAVLIGVGIALCWLGIGEGLMAAGGWLVEAGETLGDISMALVPVCLALAGLGLVFRTAAAFLVPADVYAEQLEQEGGAAESFGKMAGQKVGLDTSRTIEEATPSKPEGKAANPEAGTEGGNADEAAGAGDGAELANEAKTGNDALQNDAQAAQAKAQEHAGEQKPAEAGPESKPADATPEAKPAAKADENTEHSDEQKQGKDEQGEDEQGKDEQGKDEQGKDEKGEDEKGEDEKGEDEGGGEEEENEADKKKSAGERLKAAAKDLGRRLAESVKTSLSLGRNLGRLGSAIAEVPKLFGENAHGAVDRGLSTRAEQLEENVNEAKESLEKMGEEAETQQEKIKELSEKLNKEDGTLSEEEAAELNDQIDEAIDSWKEAREAAENLEVSLKTLEHWAARAKAGAAQKEQPSEQEGEEGDAAEDESGKKKSNEEKRREAEDEAKAKGKELKAAKSKQVEIAKDIVETNNRLEAAKAQKAEADAASEAAVKKLEADPANAEKKAASEEVAAKKAAKQHADELDAKAGKIDSAEARRKGAEGKLKQTIGKTVELGGEAAEIVGFGPEGITVKSKAGGAERTVKPEEITGGDLPADFKAQTERLAKANQDIAELTDGEPGGNAGAVAKKLHKDAADIRKAEAPKKGAKNQAKATRRNKLAADYDAQTAKAEEPAKQADEAVEAAEQKLEKLKDEQKENDGEIDDLGKEVDDAKGEAHTIRREAQRHRRTEKAMEHAGEAGANVVSALVGWQLGDEAGEKTKKFFEWLFTRPEAGLDAGGGWLMKVTTLDDRLHQLRGTVASKVGPKFDGKSGEEQEKLLAYQGMGGEEGGEKKEGGAKKEEPADKPADPKDAPSADAKADDPAAKKKDDGPAIGPAPAGGEKKEPAEEPSEEEKLKKEAWKVGHAQSLYEQLFALRPPPDIAMLGDHRKKAAAASVRYYDAHGRAYKAYQAELAVGKLAHDTAQLAEEGKPLHKQSQQSRAPIEKSKGDEAQRQQTLGGAQTGDVKGSDSRMGGMVMGLISKIGDNSDHLSAKPDAGGASGDQMSGGQDKADTESKQRTAQGKGHSQGQQQFLDQALATQQRQEQALAGNISALDAKQQQELGDRDSIRNKKAAALTDEQQARAEAESESAAFNDGYARAKAWSVQYEAKRKDVKAGGGDGP